MTGTAVRMGQSAVQAGMASCSPVARASLELGASVTRCAKRARDPLEEPVGATAASKACLWWCQSQVPLCVRMALACPLLYSCALVAGCQ
jgi:hypothetical protein